MLQYRNNSANGIVVVFVAGKQAASGRTAIFASMIENTSASVNRSCSTSRNLQCIERARNDNTQ